MTTRAPLSSPAAGDGHGQLAGVSLERARRRLAQEFRRHGVEAPELDAAPHRRPCARTRSRCARRAIPPPARARRSRRHRRAVGAPARARTGRAHPRAQGILGTAVQAQSPRPWCRGRRPRPWSRRRWRRSTAKKRRSRALRIADLGTGSGALLLALLSELPNAYGIGTDISLAALQCARDNAAALGLSARASFAACDYGSALAGSFDLLVSNPPMSRGRTSPGCRPRSATSIRGARSTAGPTVSMDIALSHRRPRACSRRAACSCWNWAGASSAPWPRFLPPRGLRQAGRNTILQVSRGPWSCAGHEAFTFQVPKKALGLWVKTD